jgi:hypothetical protein
VEVQLGYRQRPAGSPQLRRLATRLRRLLPSGRFEPIGETGLRNIVGVLPGRLPEILVGAHYDTLADPPGSSAPTTAHPGPRSSWSSHAP